MYSTVYAWTHQRLCPHRLWAVASCLDTALCGQEMESFLCLASSSAFKGSVFDEFLDASPLDLSRTTFIAASSREDISKSVRSQYYDTAFSYADTPSHHSSTLVSQIASCLRSGGTLKVSEPTVSLASHVTTFCWFSQVTQKAGSHTHIMQAGDTAAALRKALVLAGLSDIAVASLSSSSAGSRVMVSICSPPSIHTCPGLTCLLYSYGCPG